MEKVIRFLKFENNLWFTMINVRNQIIQIVACDNYDAFPHLSFIFFQLKHEIEVWKTIINIIKIYT